MEAGNFVDGYPPNFQQSGYLLLYYTSWPAVLQFHIWVPSWSGCNPVLVTYRQLTYLCGPIHIYFNLIYFFWLNLLQRMHQSWESASAIKNNRKSSLSFLHLLQSLLYLGHCVVPLILSWLPASGFTEFSTISFSILCKVLFKFFLAFLIRCLKLTCNFYGLSCSHSTKISVS